MVESRNFKPIADFFSWKNEDYYGEAVIQELEAMYRQNLQAGIISRNTYNLRIRGIRIVREVHDTGTFFWKGPADKKVSVLPKNFERIINGLVEPGRSYRKNRDIQSIIRRFLQSLTDCGITDISQATAAHIQAFLSGISPSWANSMDHVVSSLRKLNRYLAGLGMPGLPCAGLLTAPRARNRKIYPCMPPDALTLNKLSAAFCAFIADFHGFLRIECGLCIKICVNQRKMRRKQRTPLIK